ncbi:molybdopterin converting factor subunit 1 [Aliidiomarina taiwanensis]|nr:molybdopterin converting factor subunit 1 [Aliidiomarina taiwanensis]
MKVLFFAMLRERLECAELQLEQTQPTTVAEVLERLKARSEKWQATLENQELLAAINQRFVDFDASVQHGDELAFFPPVTGG